MQNQNIIGGAINIEEAYQALSPNAVPRQIRKSIKFSDEFCYIFTSGTTGIENMFYVKCVISFFSRLKCIIVNELSILFF